MAVWTLANSIDILHAAFTVGVLAHEVNSWQIQLSFTVVTCLLVIEIDCCLFHFGNLLLTIANLRDFLVLARVVLIDTLLLRLQIFKEERLDDAEGQLLVGLEDFEDEEW